VRRGHPSLYGHAAGGHGEISSIGTTPVRLIGLAHVLSGSTDMGLFTRDIGPGRCDYM